jgi:hypothetical protein
MGHSVYRGKLPSPLLDQAFDSSWFEQIWDQHPDDYHQILMHGRTVRTPRWQVTYGRDYEYTGTVNSAAPVTEDIEPLPAPATKKKRIRPITYRWLVSMLWHGDGPCTYSMLARSSGCLCRSNFVSRYRAQSCRFANRAKARLWIEADAIDKCLGIFMSRVAKMATQQEGLLSLDA